MNDRRETGCITLTMKHRDHAYTKQWPLNTKPEHGKAKCRNAHDYTNETRKRQLSGQTLRCSSYWVEELETKGS